jgi:hypothetical protein
VKLLPVILLALFHIPVLGGTLADYQGRLEAVEDTLQDLIDYTKEIRGGAIKRDTDYENRVIAEMRKSLPPTEKIEWKGSAAETANRWLHDKLDLFQAENDAAKRLVILYETKERIAALFKEVKELENPAPASRTKDEDKQKLNEILQREEYKLPEKKEESLIQRWWREFTEWLDSVFPKPKEEGPELGSAGGQSFAFILQILVYALVLGAIGFLIYKFAPLLFGRFSERVKKTKKDRVILGERIAADESADTLFSEAERLAREGNLRGAIRKGYIALLCELSDRKLIGLAQHKTNRDYLRDVRNRGELYQNMNGLTNSFERHWYGFQSVENSDWDEFRRKFKRATESPLP